jgi:uracil-DNA glycosylase
MKALFAFLRSRYALNRIVYPEPANVFRALYQTPYKQTKAIILGQDPYHGVGQANGLAFSVNAGVRIPPSLQNIYKELSDDLRVSIPKHGDLTAWAKQGVLLLNTVLTVEDGVPQSHVGKGWEIFTDFVIRLLAKKKPAPVFLLWGKSAQKKLNLIKATSPYLLAAHPSPLSAKNGFFGCRHFSVCNFLLKQSNQAIINWNP